MALTNGTDHCSLVLLPSHAYKMHAYTYAEPSFLAMNEMRSRQRRE